MERKRASYSIKTSFGWSPDIVFYALASAVNELAAGGALSFCGDVRIRLILPLSAGKPHLYEMKKASERMCRERGVRLLALESRWEASAAIPLAVVSVSAEPCGSSCPAEDEADGSAASCGGFFSAGEEAGQDIVIAKWAGAEGTARIVSEREKELGERFAPAFLRELGGLREEVFALREIAAARAGGASAIRQAGEGGISAALWRLAEESGGGFDLDMRRIPVRQETIEVCEHFRLNPYRLASAGTLLLTAGDGEALAEELHREGIEASAAGRLTAGNDKILRNGEDVRYLDRPAPDELNRIYEEAYDEGKQKRDTGVSGEAQQGGSGRAGGPAWVRGGGDRE